MNKIVIILFLFSPYCIAAQDQTDSSICKTVFALTLQRGTALVHKASVSSAKDVRPVSIGVDYSFQHLDYSSYSICRTYLRSGFNLSYIDFNSPVFGEGVIASIFLQPVYRIGKNFQFQFRGDAGVGYFTKPYNEITNKTNLAYSNHFTPYLHVSSGVGFRITKKITTEINGHFNHISNGHANQPNAGLNWMMLSASVLYYPDNNKLPKYNYVHTKRKPTGPFIDAGIMFTPRQAFHDLWQVSRRYMLGIFGQASFTVSRINAITAGTEIAYSNYQTAAAAPHDNSQPAVTAAITIGNDFLLGKMIFSQQLGKYVSDHPSFHHSIYHRWGLRYKLGKHLYAGFNLKVHKEVADLIDFRLQYRF